MLHSKPKYTAVHKQAFRALSLTHTHYIHPEDHCSDCTAKESYLQEFWILLLWISRTSLWFGFNIFACFLYVFCKFQMEGKKGLMLLSRQGTIFERNRKYTFFGKYLVPKLITLSFKAVFSSLLQPWHIFYKRKIPRHTTKQMP